MLIDDIERIIRSKPGLKATEIAAELYGASGYHQRVAAECRALVHIGRIERRGDGGPGDPYRYFPHEADLSSAEQPRGRSVDGGESCCFQ